MLWLLLTDVEMLWTHQHVLVNLAESDVWSSYGCYLCDSAPLCQLRDPRFLGLFPSWKGVESHSIYPFPIPIMRTVVATDHTAILHHFNLLNVNETRYGAIVVAKLFTNVSEELWICISMHERVIRFANVYKYLQMCVQNRECNHACKCKCR